MSLKYEPASEEVWGSDCITIIIIIYHYLLFHLIYGSIDIWGLGVGIPHPGLDGFWGRKGEGYIGFLLMMRTPINFDRHTSKGE